MSHIDVLVEGNHPMPETKRSIPTDVENKIGEFIAGNLVQEGATLQMGIFFYTLLITLHYEHKNNNTLCNKFM